MSRARTDKGSNVCSERRASDAHSSGKIVVHRCTDARSICQSATPCQIPALPARHHPRRFRSVSHFNIAGSDLRGSSPGQRGCPWHRSGKVPSAISLMFTKPLREFGLCIRLTASLRASTSFRARPIVRRGKLLVFGGCNSHPATGSLQPVAILLPTEWAVVCSRADLALANAGRSGIQWMGGFSSTFNLRPTGPRHGATNTQPARVEGRGRSGRSDGAEHELRCQFAKADPQGPGRPALRSKPLAGPRMRVVWAVCDMGGRTVATFDYADKAQAEKHIADLKAKGKGATSSGPSRNP